MLVDDCWSRVWNDVEKCSENEQENEHFSKDDHFWHIWSHSQEKWDWTWDQNELKMAWKWVLWTTLMIFVVTMTYENGEEEQAVTMNEIKLTWIYLNI